ncbi:MAG: bacteriocin [Streptococcaceae bacterium]|jgi:bacteriocin-like protein|nr:bacteriocin [Streptococcaceae bacterium]
MLNENTGLQNFQSISKKELANITGGLIALDPNPYSGSGKKGNFEIFYGSYLKGLVTGLFN